jgi:23S rRNA (cytidine2498-2'-O)-methyltransferase
VNLPQREFVWVVHQPGVAKWLKRELGELAPALRFAFARPGLSTFKLLEPPSDTFVLPSSFARAWGFSLGRVATIDELLARSEGLTDGPLRLHVFERETEGPVESQHSRGQRAAALAAALHERAPERWLPDPLARVGELVLDVITPPADQPDDEPWLLGWHVHDAWHGPEPGGVAHVPAPAASPSRAWSKIEEAIRWSALEPRAGERALEIGASPGGACLALLDRGLEVIGIDPGPIAETVLARARFTHVPRPFAELERRELSRLLARRIDWLLLDVNLAPAISLRFVERVLGWLSARPRGCFLTIKLNDDKVAATLPRVRARLHAIAGAGARVRLTQLPSHGSEVIAVIDWP